MTKYIPWIVIHKFRQLLNILALLEKNFQSLIYLLLIQFGVWDIYGNEEENFIIFIF